MRCRARSQRALQGRARRLDKLAVRAQEVRARADEHSAGLRRGGGGGGEGKLQCVRAHVQGPALSEFYRAPMPQTAVAEEQASRGKDKKGSSGVSSGIRLENVRAAGGAAQGQCPRRRARRGGLPFSLRWGSASTGILAATSAAAGTSSCATMVGLAGYLCSRRVHYQQPVLRRAARR